jgi:WD40 repeat protein
MLLATGCDDDKLRIFDAASQQELPTGVVDTGSPVACLAWSGDGKTLAAGLQSGEFLLVKSVEDESGEQRASSSFHTITSIAWHPQNPRLLAVGDEEGLLWIWDLQRMAPVSGRIDRQLDSFRGMVSGNAELNKLITTGSIRLTERRVRPCRQLAWSPDGGRIAVAEDGAEVWAFRRVEGLRWMTSLPSDDARRSGLASAPGPITTVAWHPLGRSLALGAGDGQVIVCDVTNGQPVRQFRAPAEVGSVAFSRRGRHLAAGSRDGTLTVWEF